MTQIGHAPIGIAGAAGKGAFKGVGMVGHGVGSVGGFAGRKIGSSATLAHRRRISSSG